MFIDKIKQMIGGVKKSYQDTRAKYIADTKQFENFKADKQSQNRGIVSPLPMTKNPYSKAITQVIAATPAPKITTKPMEAKKPIQRQLSPTPTPLPIRIAIPSSSGQGETIVPEPAASALMKAFDQYGEATNAAQVMHHPMQVSGTPNEIKAGYNNFGNMGENGRFNPVARNEFNSNGTVDSGLMQTNSGTFAGMQAQPFWNQAMQKRGITSFDQMTDPYKNAMMNMLILMRGNFDPETGSMKQGPRNYKQWFAAPAKQRWD